ncbi:MAG: hypothetical protein JXB49_32385 [Bacteroidales bacterium]|nr:hypothetical protein [Bacteroidales bacterium]
MNKVIYIALVLLFSACATMHKAMDDHYILYYKIKALKVVKAEVHKNYYRYTTVAISSNRWYYIMSDTVKYEPGDTIVLKDAQYGQIRFRKYFENQ